MHYDKNGLVFEIYLASISLLFINYIELESLEYLSPTLHMRKWSGVLSACNSVHILNSDQIQKKILLYKDFLYINPIIYNRSKVHHGWLDDCKKELFQHFFIFLNDVTDKLNAISYLYDLQNKKLFFRLLIFLKKKNWQVLCSKS